MNNPELREIAFNAPEMFHRRIVGGGRVKTSALSWKYTRAQTDHWADTSITAHYFLFRQMGYSPRQFIAAQDWKIA